MRNNATVWQIFIKSFVSIVHGTTSFSRNSQAQLVSTFTSTSNEAFALLVIECYYGRWTAIAMGATEKKMDEKDLPEPRYISKKGDGKGTG